MERKTLTRNEEPGSLTAETAARTSWLRYIHPLNASLMAGIRARAQREPLWRVMQWAARGCNLILDLRRGGIVPSGPQLVVGNDPSPLMGFIILSLMPRDDVYFFGGPGWLKLGGSVSEHCLAVFNVGDPRKYPKEWLRAQLLFRFRDGMKPSAAREINRRSIERAADLVTSGATVYISPAGGTMARADNWKHGVGSLARRIGDVPAQVVMCRADNTTPRDFARMLNPYWFAAMRRPRVIPVQFSDPMPLSDFRVPGMGSMDVSLRIRDRYLELYGSL